ncbi:MDR family MFS transporter [Asticcacaulis taihuensis]|uniref:MDR family MFS transporter n=1 Tax=Asticcacaulis taihuensis TaxID=260084 RepID=UPI003F7C8B1B
MTQSPTAAAPAPASQLEPKDVQRIIIGLMAVLLLAALDQTIVSTALPTIGRELGDVQHLPWMVTAYLLSSTVVTPLYGKLADIIGRRTTLLMAIGIFLFGSLLCSLSPNMYVLIAARAVQGLGGGGLMSLVQTVISDIVTAKERGRIQGVFAAVFTASSLGGPILGGVLSEHLGWQSIFWVNLPVGAVALWIVSRGLMKLPRYERPHRIDWLGAVLMAAAAIILLLAINTRGAAVMGVPLWAVYIVSAAFWGLFALRLRTAAEPLIPTGILKDGVIVRAILVSTLSMGALMSVSAYNPLYVQLIYHMGATQAGLVMTPLALGVVGGSILSGQMMARGKGTGYKLMPMIGLFAGAVVYAGMAVIGDRLNLWAYIGGLFFANAAVGSTFPVATVVVQNSVERHEMGTATGVMNFFRSLGGALLVAVFGAILFGELYALLGGSFHGALSADTVSRVSDPARIYKPIFTGAAVSMGLAFLALWSMRERPLRSHEMPVAKAAEEATGETLSDADFS